MCMLAVVVIIPNDMFLALKQTTTKKKKKNLLCFAIKRSFSSDRSYPVFCILIAVMCFLGCYCCMHLCVCVRQSVWLHSVFVTAQVHVRAVLSCQCSKHTHTQNNCEYGVHLKNHVYIMAPLFSLQTMYRKKNTIK